MTYEFIHVPHSFRDLLAGKTREEHAHNFLYDAYGSAVVSVNDNGEPAERLVSSVGDHFEKNKRGWVAYAGQKCSRCGGEGGWKGWPNWVCYRCGGDGKDPKLSRTALYTADAAEKLCARRKAKEDAERAAERAQEEREAAAREARIAELANDERYVALCNLKGNFAADIRERLEDGKNWDDLSDKQVAAVDRMIAKVQAAADAQASSQHIGAPRERFAFEATVVASRQIGHEPFYPYAPRYLSRLVTTDGNVLVWFSNKHLERFVDQQVTGKATVKKHDSYRDTAQTIVTRLKVDQDA